jgi:ABC-type glycerol-3-phosphate transport system substrate-binding protein
MEKFLVKKYQLVLLAILCVALLGMGIVTSAQSEVTLTAWTHDQLYLDYFNSRLEEWEALHPDITFTYDFQIIPNAPEAALTALAAGEEMPDLLGIEQGGFPNFMRDGVIADHFLDMTDLIGDRRSEYAEGRWALYSYEGGIYAIESSLTASVYYFQPAIFEENGVEVPTTWEGALDLYTNGFPSDVALTVATNDANWFQMLFNERGGAVFDESSEFVFNTEENQALAVEVASFIKEGIDAGLFLVVLGGDHWSGVTIPTAYREGRLAGQVMPDWWSTCCLKPGVEDMAGQWRITTPFVWEGGGYETLVWGGTGWAVSTDTPDSEIAWQFLEFMYLGEESQIRRFEQINMFPTNFAAMEDERVTALTDPFYGDQQIGEIYAELGDGVPVWYQSPFRAAFATAVGDNLPLLFDGTISAEEFVEEVTRITEEEIEFGS